MAIWLGMAITVIIIPALMIICGKYYIKKAPKSINHFVGYRTNRSMKNKDTWNFAHNYLGRLWVKIGLPVLVASVLPMIAVLGKDYDTISILSSIITVIQIIPILISIVLTEKALKNKFDENGERKQ